jgi:hypothetical protein
VLPALIALNAATDVWPPLRGLQRVTARVADRPLHAGEMSAADVGLGSTAGVSTFNRLAGNLSFTLTRRAADVHVCPQPASSGRSRSAKIGAPMTRPKVQQTQLDVRAR